MSLLKHALTLLWNCQRDGWLTHEAYETEVGKLEGAIRKKADEILYSSDVGNPQLALTALTRLVRVSSSEADGGDTRQRVPLNEFNPEERACLEPFVKARLLVASGSWHESDGQPSPPDAQANHNQSATLEVAHEALIRHWPTLQDALKDKRELLIWRQTIRPQYESWQQLNKTGGKPEELEALLLQGFPLKQGLKWLKERQYDLTGDESEFLQLSQEREQKEQTFSRIGKSIALDKIIEPEMVIIPAGSFQMGSNNGRDSEKPVHHVILKSFAIGRYAVTFDEYDQFAKALGKPKPDDSGLGREKHPVINVKWEDAVAYVQWLSTVTGKNFRLPTEAEWEYAARANTTTDYYWGGHGVAKDFAWFDGNSEGKTHPVGQKKPNAFGLYDMSGNVREWVEDCWHDNYDQAPDDGSAWQDHNGVDCFRRVVRGGSLISEPVLLQSADRRRGIPDDRGIYNGFRLAQD